MRLWSLHPGYLDPQGLVALWREALLAKHVLEGKTRGYVNHPQLCRFKQVDNPLCAVNQYLSEVYHESAKRGYCFDHTKINWTFENTSLPVTRGQLAYEWQHLLGKLAVRNTSLFHILRKREEIQPNRIFHITDGEVENWEIVGTPARKQNLINP